MNSMLRWALPATAFASLAAAAIGCVITIEPAVYYYMDPITESVPYEDGDSVRVVQANGKTTIRRGSGSEIVAKFDPSTMRPDGEDEEAKAEMQNDLTLTIEDQGDTVLVRVAKASGSSSGLGADVTVTLPASFSGNIAVSSNNGGLDLSGASGQLSIKVDNGSSKVAVQEWSPLDGTVHVGNGGLSFTVASGLNGWLTAESSGASPAVNDPSPLPADWQVTATSNASKQYSFGADPSLGGTVALTTGNGAIDLFVR